MPYLYKTSVDTSRSGVPTMRSMVLEFTRDRNCWYLDKQYMLGDNLLVAPIFNDESVGSFYLPQGTWTDFFTGEEMTGGVWTEKTYDYLHLPLMVRENSIVALGSCDDKPDYDYADGVELRVYALADNQECSTVVYDMQQKADLQVSITKSADTITIKAENAGGKPYTVRLVNVQAASASGAAMTVDDKDTILTPEADKVTVTL